MSRGEHLGEFEQIVLLAVARLGRDGYGVTVRQEIQERTGRAVAVGAVYATLDRLEGKGLVASFEGQPTSERGGRARRHFHLLPAGARALDASRRMLAAMWDGVELA
jgi:DNA-binding PadR family transcriptional regulator